MWTGAEFNEENRHYAGFSPMSYGRVRKGEWARAALGDIVNGAGFNGKIPPPRPYMRQPEILPSEAGP